MCSIAEKVSGALASGAPLAPAEVAALVEHAREANRAVASLLADPATAVVVTGMPSDVVAELATAALATADAATAAGTVLAGQVAASTGPGSLIAGRYASARRWLEVEAGLSAASAKGVLARGRDLRGASARVGEAWLSGRVSGDAVRELTLGVSGALKRVEAPSAEIERLRVDALDVLVPLAERATPGDVHAAVQRLRFALDPDGASQDAMDAYDSQSLTVEVVGPMSRISAWVTHETAAAVMTVIDQEARRVAVDAGRELVHAPGCALVLAAAIGPDDGRSSVPGTGSGTGPGAGANADDAPVLACTCGAVSSTSWAHTRAVALGGVMTGLLDNGLMGSHHGVAPHVTLTVDVDTALSTRAPDGAPLLVGELAIPGRDDPVLIPDATVRRILCDADLTRVLTTAVSAVSDLRAASDADRHCPSEARCADEHEPAAGTGLVSTAEACFSSRARLRPPGQRGWHRPLGSRCSTATDVTTRTRDHGHAHDVLRADAREVLWVGRAQRTVTPRQRRALDARDQHCVAPGCRAPARRCHAHHVVHWQHGGDTSIDNLALLCVAHHHAVHEGGWTITRTTGTTPGQPGAFTLAPPPRPRRP